jgi:hypothetical protein
LSISSLATRGLRPVATGSRSHEVGPVSEFEHVRAAVEPRAGRGLHKPQRDVVGPQRLDESTAPGGHRSGAPGLTPVGRLTESRIVLFANVL